MSDTLRRPPRWDPDDRGIGVGDARAHLPALDALRLVADEAGWVAEDPEAHLLPHLASHLIATSVWLVDGVRTTADGTFEVDARWAGVPDPDRRTVRAAAYVLIGEIAEAATAVHERRDPDGTVTFDVVTGMLPGESRFASHGHTFRLRVRGPAEAGRVEGLGA